MGDGSRLDEDDLIRAYNVALANMGSMASMFFGPINPQYSPTPWKDYKLTKRETALAKLHTVVAKLVKIDDESWEHIVKKSTTRLKRAKWAQYKNIK